MPSFTYAATGLLHAIIGAALQLRSKDKVAAGQIGRIDIGMPQTEGCGADQAIGGGTPCTLADSAGSQPQTAHACRTDDWPKSSAARWGSGLARASSQSSTYSPSPASQWAAAGDSVAAANPSGVGYA
jgi:hypothetical protein